VDTALKHRVNAGRVAVRNQQAFFLQQRGRVASEWKPDETRVTFADFAISEKLLEELWRSFPDDQMLSEESGLMDERVPLTSKYAWVLDPIDGTNNYALGMSACAISLALLKQGRPVYGFIFDGSTGQLLEGGPGQPLRIDGKKTEPERRTFDLNTGIVAVHFPLAPVRVRQLEPLLSKVRIRSLGSAALHLAYVALGRLDGAFDERVRLWDIAAGVALMESGGGRMRYLGPDPFPVEAFDQGGPHIRYLAGSEGFLGGMEKWLS